MSKALTEKQLAVWALLAEDFPDEDVQIEGAVNLKSRPISEHKVRLAYGELTLIVAMIRDYIKELDERRENRTIGINPLEYDVYYRPKFLNIAERISKQINYSYEAQVEKCIKKMSKQSSSDVGEEALALAMKRGNTQNKSKTESEETQNGTEQNHK